MRVPGEVLERVRGAVVVGAMLTACAVPPPAPPPIAPEPMPVARAAVGAPDALSYASPHETARLARLDVEDDAAQNVRAVRIADASAERQTRRAASRSGIGGRGGHGCMACGRG